MSIILNDQLIAGGGSGGASLPDQEGNAGKFLTTDGTDASWANLSSVTKVVTASGSNASTWYRIWSDGFKEMGGVIATSASDVTWERPNLTTSDGTLGGDSFAVEASHIYSNSHPAWHAVDGSLSTAWYWASNSNYFPATYTFYNPVALKVSTLTITNRKDSNAAFTGGSIEASNNGSSWSTIVSSWSNSVTTKGGIWSISVNSTNYYKYYRITSTSGQFGSGGIIGYAELNISATYQGSGGSSITFPYSFSDTNYSFNLSYAGSSNSSIYVSSKTTTGMTLNSTPSGTCYWSAFGY